MSVIRDLSPQGLRVMADTLEQYAPLRNKIRPLIIERKTALDEIRKIRAKVEENRKKIEESQAEIDQAITDMYAANISGVMISEYLGIDINRVYRILNLPDSK